MRITHVQQVHLFLNRKIPFTRFFAILNAMCNIRDGLLISYLYLGGYGGDWNRSSNDSGGRSGWGSSNAYPVQDVYPRQQQQQGGREDWGRPSNDQSGPPSSNIHGQQGRESHDEVVAPLSPVANSGKHKKKKYLIGALFNLLI